MQSLWKSLNNFLGKGMEPVVEGFESIYFEQQQNGELTCGKCALNNLLQQQAFTDDELLVIATMLDDDEKRYYNRIGASHNASDNGYYSMETLISALKKKNITLTRVGGAETIERFENLNQQHAFIIHNNDHYYVYRQFRDCWFLMDSLRRKPVFVTSEALTLNVANLVQSGNGVYAVTEGLKSCRADEAVRILRTPQVAEDEGHVVGGVVITDPGKLREQRLKKFG